MWVALNLMTSSLRNPSTDAPVIKKMTSPTRCVMGLQVVLRCHVNAFPAPTIKWSKDGHDVIMTKRHFLTDNDHLLIISAVTSSDGGVYKCNATNRLGSRQSKTLLVIVESKRGVVVTSSSEQIWFRWSWSFRSWILGKFLWFWERSWSCVSSSLLHHHCLNHLALCPLPSPTSSKDGVHRWYRWKSVFVMTSQLIYRHQS